MEKYLIHRLHRLAQIIGLDIWGDRLININDDIRDGIGRLGSWLREAAWPAWLANGIDRDRGGFFEALDLHGKTCTADFRRLRVVARQIYVFSEAHRAGLGRRRRGG